MKKILVALLLLKSFSVFTLDRKPILKSKLAPASLMLTDETSKDNIDKHEAKIRNCEKCLNQCVAQTGNVICCLPTSLFFIYHLCCKNPF